MQTKLPFILSVLTMLLGVFISILFGVNEKIFKDKIARDLAANPKLAKIVDVEKREAKMKYEQDKNWRYYQRFHFHSTGIGAMSLGALILLSFTLAPAMLRLASAYMISVGGLLYPFVWLFAGIYGPVMGRSEAKATFEVFGYMGGVFLVGLFLLIFALFKYPNRLSDMLAE